MVLAGLVGTVLSFSILAQRDTGPSVAVAARHIRAGERVAEDMFTFVAMKGPKDSLASLIRPSQVRQLTGWTVTSEIPAGELVTRSRLRPRPAAQERSMNIVVEPEEVPAGLQAGDRIDVVAADRDGHAAYVLSGAQVLDVSPGLGGSGSGSGLGARASGALGLRSKNYITVAVDADSARNLVGAQAAAAKIAIVRTTGAPEAKAG